MQVLLMVSESPLQLERNLTAGSGGSVRAAMIHSLKMLRGARMSATRHRCAHGEHFCPMSSLQT